jgi:hypothetical protein
MRWGWPMGRPHSLSEHHLRRDFRFGTRLPFLRASDNPIAMACLRLLTFLPLRPLLSVPFLRFRIARFTSFDALREYLRAMVNPPLGNITMRKSSESPMKKRLLEGLVPYIAYRAAKDIA